MQVGKWVVVEKKPKCLPVVVVGSWVPVWVSGADDRPPWAEPCPFLGLPCNLLLFATM